MHDLIQILGAILILFAFFAAQRNRMSPQAASYLSINLLGSSILAIVALLGSDWGFLLLEEVWAAVSALALIEIFRGRTKRSRSVCS